MKASAMVDLGSRVAHTWTVRPDPASPEAFHDLSVLFEDFDIAISRGAFADGSGPSSCRVEQRTGEDRLAVSFDLTSVDVRYARVLRNYLYSFEQINQLPLDVQAVQTPPARAPLGLVVLEAEVERETFYPALLPRLPFRVERVDSHRADQDRRLLLEFAAPVDVATERALTELVMYWSRLAEFGYAPSEDDLRDGRYGIFGAAGAVFDEVSYDVTVATFLAPEAAWSSLLNMIAFANGPRCVRAELE